MSTTGHYTRYINQFPGWSDNCDTMYQYVPSPLTGLCEICKNKNDCTHSPKHCCMELGYYQVEHYAGNKHAWCSFCWGNPGYNTYRVFTDGYIGPLISGDHKFVISYTGKNAIQHVLEMAKSLKVSDMVDIIFNHNFYQYSYMDYFAMYQELA